MRNLLNIYTPIIANDYYSDYYHEEPDLVEPNTLLSEEPMSNKLTLSNNNDNFDENEDVVDCKYLHRKTNVVKILNEKIPVTNEIHPRRGDILHRSSGPIHHNQVMEDFKTVQYSGEEDHFKVAITEKHPKCLHTFLRF